MTERRVPIFGNLERHADDQGEPGSLPDGTALRDSANAHRLRLAVDAAELAIWDWDIRRNTLLWDNAMFELYGMEPDDFDGAFETWTNRLHPADVGQASEDVRAALTGSREFNTEFRVILPDGRLRWIRAIATIIRDEQGQAERAVGVNWDQTKRKEAEDTLEQILKGIAPTTGTDFFRQLADHLSRACQVDYAFIGAIDRTDPQVVNSIAASSHGEPIEDFTYRLAKTPSENVIAGRELCYYPAVVHETFREDEILTQMGIESYMGVPLCRGDGSPIGLIGLLHGGKMANARQAKTILRAVAARSEVELERSMFEESLLEANEFNAQVLAESPHGIVVLDRDLRYRLWNPAMERLTGLPAEKVLGSHPEDFPFLRTAGVVDAMRRALQGEIVPTGDFRFHIHSTGKRGWAANIIAPMKDSKGEIIGVLSSVLDTTASREASEENQRLLHALGERVKELTCLYQAAETLRDNTRSVGEWLQALVDQIPAGWQYPEDTAVRITYGQLELTSPRFEQAQWRQGSDFVDGSGTGGSIEVVYLSEHPAAAEGPFLEEERRLINSISEMLTHAVNRRILEEQIRQSQRMEAIGQLAGGIAHDFNNLLTVINGYSELIMSSLKKNDPILPRLEQILKAGKRSAELTQQLLAFSRKQILAPKTLNLNDIVLDTQRMLRRTIGENIELVTDLDPELNFVRADPGQVQQVLLNLVVNARDAMPSGGRLSIETRNVDLPTKPNGADNTDQEVAAHVKLSVGDTGVGMSEETKRKIFEPFFTTKSLGEGTGLGLAVVHGIVQQSDGRIEVRTAPGTGSTFDVYLPALTDPAEVSPEIHLSEPAPIGSETILLVEDELAVRNLAEEILKEFGYHVLTAADGETALQICAQQTSRIDLVITDVVMPGMGGHAVAQKIVETCPDVKVLFLSGYPDNDVVRHGILHDKVNFLQKPFSADALGRKIREILKA